LILLIYNRRTWVQINTSQTQEKLQGGVVKKPKKVESPKLKSEGDVKKEVILIPKNKNETDS